MASAVEGMENLVALVEASRDAIVEETIDLCKARVDSGSIPADRLDEIRHHTYTSLTYWVGLFERDPVEDNYPLRLPDHLAEAYERLGRIRYQEGVPLRDVVSIPCLAAEATWVVLARFPQDTIAPNELARALRLSMVFTSAVLQRIAKGYGSEETLRGGMPTGDALAEHLDDPPTASFEALLAAGLTPAASYRILAMSITGSNGNTDPPQQLTRSGWLAAALHGLVVLLVPDGDESDALRVLDDNERCAQSPIAVSSPSPPNSVAHAYAEARETLDVAGRLALGGHVRADAIHIALAREIRRNPSAYLPFVQILDPLKDEPDCAELLETLRVYFSCDRSWRRARQSLCLTEGGLRHRLDRIQRLLGSPLRTNAGMYEVALLAQRLIGP